MTRTRKWLLGAGMAAGVLAALAVLIASMIPSDEELARRAAGELETALGVPVSIGALHWALLPSPRVVIENAATRQPQAIEVRQLTAWLNPSALWRRRIRVDRAEVQGAVLPQLSLRGLGSQAPAATPGRQKIATLDDVPLSRIEWRDVTWVSRWGVRTVYDGNADFDAGWRPRSARLVRAGASPAAELALTRQGQEDRWAARIQVGGGTADGSVQLQAGDKGGFRLTGQFKPQGIEVASALQAFNHRSILGGKLSGDTTLSASGDTPGELVRSLRTRTNFSMGHSTLLRFDLDKAIRSLGREHAGQTPLDSITGQLDTQNTAQGMVASYSRIRTASGVFSASGKARIADRQIDAEFAVDLVDGVIGIPLTVSGPLDKVHVSVPASALAGAAAGTVVLPGIGTAIGARIGAAIGKLLGSKPKPPAPQRLAPVTR